MRYFLHLAYDGTNYCGWQVQANAPSVQETINKALEKLLRQHIGSMGCGRTDTGVHAKDFYMHFECSEIANLDNFLFRLNCVLPRDISVFKIIPLHDKAHARFDATERTYEYFMHFQKNPYIHLYSFYYGFYQVDWSKILEATAYLKTVSDFTSLCLPSEDFKTNICHISEARWDVLPAHDRVLRPYLPDDAYEALAHRTNSQVEPHETLRFVFTSNRFLRGMVRKTVGTLLHVGKGKISVDEFQQTIADKKEFRVHYLAPPTGLFLSKIKYPYITD
ncbi:MAG: tRNA pseudouridine synthase A [Bacteroidetes bacterium]|nr:tRNA pseudouridine synthase A [Bacteroidota bacterium]